MNAWFKNSYHHSSKFFSTEEGAVATEYAILIVLLVVVVAATVYSMADFKGDGVAQKAFEKVGNQAGQFGQIRN